MTFARSSNNLIANAIDAMRQNGGRLIVRAHEVTAESELVTESSLRWCSAASASPSPTPATA